MSLTKHSYCSLCGPIALTPLMTRYVLSTDQSLQTIRSESEPQTFSSSTDYTAESINPTRSDLACQKLF